MTDLKAMKKKTKIWRVQAIPANFVAIAKQ